MGLTTEDRIERREFWARVAGGFAAAACGIASARVETRPFELRYIAASSMYGCMKLAEILPEVGKVGAGHIDIWPRPHGDQREQVETIGHAAFKSMLDETGAALGILTHYDLGPFGLQEEMRVARQFGGTMVICGGSGPTGLSGDALKTAVRAFVEQMKPHVAVAEELGITIGIENHANNLIESPDAMRWLAEFAPSRHLGIALAPYHLPQDVALLASLIQELGDHLVHFYAWQHGKGCHEKLPKEDELLQMPGRGSLDFAPALAALRKINYAGWTEVFMHPVPRGIPIRPTAAEVTAEINRARYYLEARLNGS